MRFIALKNINRQLSWLLSLVDLSSTHPSSLGARLSCIPHYMFYDKKTSFLHSVLNAATRRTLDQAPPEIKMDPLENVGGMCTCACTIDLDSFPCYMYFIDSFPYYILKDLINKFSQFSHFAKLK